MGATGYTCPVCREGDMVYREEHLPGVDMCFMECPACDVRLYADFHSWNQALKWCEDNTMYVCDCSGDPVVFECDYCGAKVHDCADKEQWILHCPGCGTEVRW